MDRQAVLDVLNSLEVFESNGGEDAYILVENTSENRERLIAAGVREGVFEEYGDEETFCVLAVAFGEGYADDYQNGQFVLWDSIDDELRYRVINGEGTPSDAERLLRALEPNLFPKKTNAARACAKRHRKVRV